MNEELLKYDLLFSGKITPGSNREIIQDRLIRILKIPASQIYALFEGNKIALAQNISHERAVLIQEKMLKIGALCDIEPSPNNTEANNENIFKNNTTDNFEKKSNKTLKNLLPLIFFPVMSLFLQYDWKISLYATFLSTLIFVHPIIIDRMNFLAKYYSANEEISRKKSRLLKNFAIAMFEAISISFITINLSSFSDESGVFFVYLVFFILSYKLLQYRNEKFGGDHERMFRIFYFKDSIIIGLIFSTVSAFFQEKPTIESAYAALVKGDVPSALSLMNKSRYLQAGVWLSRNTTDILWISNGRSTRTITNCTLSRLALKP